MIPARVRSWRGPLEPLVQLFAREGVYAQLRLRSGETGASNVECRATIGEVGNEEHSLWSIGGLARCVGAVFVRPFVAWVMNPVDPGTVAAKGVPRLVCTWPRPKGPKFPDS